MLLSLIRMIQAFREYQRNVAELRQLGNVALILTERLDHADEREQHEKSPLVRDSVLRWNLIVEMNIEEIVAVRKRRCCDAAKPPAHSSGNGRVRIGQGRLAPMRTVKTPYSCGFSIVRSIWRIEGYRPNGETIMAWAPLVTSPNAWVNQYELLFIFRSVG